MILESFLSSILDSWTQLALWLVGFFIIFGLLARWMPCNPKQSIHRRETMTDITYAFALPILNPLAHVVFVGLGIFILFHGESQENIARFLRDGYGGPIGELPIWLQAALLFLLSDIILYWIHRGFHGARMWRFHAIHHSPAAVNWHSAFRFHPVNIWLSTTFLGSAILFLGFSPAAAALFAIFNLIYSTMVHANLNWTFGPFRYVFASPVFHRWHHTAQEEGMDKNFAPTFPLIDIVFGTFYMPENRLPERYGVPGSNIPPGFWGQMIWPFRKP